MLLSHTGDAMCVCVRAHTPATDHAEGLQSEITARSHPRVALAETKNSQAAATAEQAGVCLATARC